MRSLLALVALILVAACAMGQTTAPGTTSQSYEYLGWFAGTVDLKVFPATGYYYSPNTPVPLKALENTVVVKVKELDGGSVCPSLTRYRTYLYSPTPLPGEYMLPDAGRRLYPLLPVGWPLRPLSSLGWQLGSP
ncbi:MAG: hypothetical protein H5T86_04240 [Armatimonadetes bacterium]|nr:hypothetical protein [Armatimonadota bacterium]